MRVCGLSLFLILATLPAPSQQAVSAPAGGQIVVWKGGSPHTGDTPDTTVPPDLELNAAKIGDSIRIEAFPATGFAQTFFDALQNHQEPDVLAFDNFGIIDGITTALGNFTGIGSSATVRKNLVQVTNSLKDFQGARGGWQFLITTSKNYQAARLLALSPPQCGESLLSTRVPDEMRPIAQRISDSYLQQSASLQTYEDPDRLIAEGVRRYPFQVSYPLQVSETKACASWGNDRLAFISMVSTYHSANLLGQMNVLLVLRKQDTQWQLLCASTDPISNGMFLSRIRQISRVLRKPSSIGNQPIPAELISPVDAGFPTPAAGERFGNFTWQPSPSDGVVAETVEFAYENDARLLVRMRPTKPTADEVSAGQLWITNSQWKWRVWSITDAGEVLFSQTGSFQH